MPFPLRLWPCYGRAGAGRETASPAPGRRNAVPAAPGRSTFAAPARRCRCSLRCNSAPPRRRTRSTSPGHSHPTPRATGCAARAPRRLPWQTAFSAASGFFAFQCDRFGSCCIIARFGENFKKKMAICAFSRFFLHFCAGFSTLRNEGKAVAMPQNHVIAMDK